MERVLSRVHCGGAEATIARTLGGVRPTGLGGREDTVFRWWLSAAWGRSRSYGWRDLIGRDVDVGADLVLRLTGQAVSTVLDGEARVQYVHRVGAVAKSRQNGRLVQDAVVGETKGSPAQPMLREILVPVPRSDA